MFIIYLAAVAVHLFSILQYRRFRGSYVSFHTILLLFSAAIFCEFGSIIMLMIYYSHLGNTGSSAGGWNSLGELLDMASQLIYLFILVLIAKVCCRGRLVFCSGSFPAFFFFFFFCSI